MADVMCRALRWRGERPAPGRNELLPPSGLTWLDFAYGLASPSRVAGTLELAHAGLVRLCETCPPPHPPVGQPPRHTDRTPCKFQGGRAMDGPHRFSILAATCPHLANAPYQAGRVGRILAWRVRPTVGLRSSNPRIVRSVSI